MESIDADSVRQRLTSLAAIDALETAISADGVPEGPARMHLHHDEQQLLVMPAMGEDWSGVKLVTIDPANPARELPLIHGIYTLFGPPGMQPTAVIDGAALTELRTAAVSGLATRHLARPDASRLVVFGAGVQGRSHLLAMAAVRELSEVRIVAPRQASVDAFIAFAADHLDVPVLAGTPDDVADADLVCTCTSSPTPVFDGELLAPGTHVNAIGAYRPDMQEIDVEAVACSRVLVESRGPAMSENGDLILAEASGQWDRGQIVADLGELLHDGATVRRTPDDRTLFASVGMAFEDLIIARAVVAGPE